MCAEGPVRHGAIRLTTAGAASGSQKTVASEAESAGSTGKSQPPAIWAAAPPDQMRVLCLVVSVAPEALPGEAGDVERIQVVVGTIIAPVHGRHGQLPCTMDASPFGTLLSPRFALRLRLPRCSDCIMRCGVRITSRRICGSAGTSESGKLTSRDDVFPFSRLRAFTASRI